MFRPRLFRRVLLAVTALAVLSGGVAQAAQPVADYIAIFTDEAVGEDVSTSRDPLVETAWTGAGNAFAERVRGVDRQRVKKHVDRLRKQHGISPSEVFDSAVGGFAARLTQAQWRALRDDPEVAIVEPDVQVSLDLGSAEGGQAQSLDRGITLSSAHVPNGVRRVGANVSSVARIDGTDDRVDVDVAVLDTGVEPGHPDLNVVGGYNCLGTNRSSFGDGYGHGTHVAGTIGALDNGHGVVGVAPGARIWAVKVLNSDGMGSLSSVVCGIDWVTAQRDPRDPARPLIEVANMSLRFSLAGSNDRDCGVPANDAMHRAICRSVSRGTVYAVAAGNVANDARHYRPAAYDEVITVGAIVDFDGKPGGLGARPSGCPQTGSDDAWASYSNYGADLSLVGPSNCTLSTWIGGKYAWMAGTSASSPHVAGGAALYRARYPDAQPQQVRMALEHVGQRDWRLSTAPAGGRVKLLWVGSFAAPPEFSLGAVSTSQTLGAAVSLALPVSIRRTNGHTAPVSIRVKGLPAGATASSPMTTGSSARVILRASSTTPSGVYRVTLQATDGEIERSRSLDLAIDTERPTATFTRPAAGSTSSQSSTTVAVSWTESDTGGSGIRSRSVQRQRALPAVPGSCGDAIYKNVGRPRKKKADFTVAVAAGHCFRWRVTVTDNAGNSASFFSGMVYIKTS